MNKKKKFLPGDLVKSIIDKNMRIIIASDNIEVMRFVNFTKRPLSRINHAVTSDWNPVWRSER